MSRYYVTNVFYCKGLGIDPQPWISCAKQYNYEILPAIPLNAKRLKCYDRLYKLTIIFGYISRIFDFISLKKCWFVVYSEKSSFFFKDNINRLPVNQNASFCRLPALLILLIKLLPLPSFITNCIYSQLLLSIKFSRFSTTIHNFSIQSRFFGLKPLIFVDGLHPPNYHRSCGIFYRGYDIVRRSNFDHPWFEANKCSVYSFPDIINEYCINNLKDSISAINAINIFDKSKNITLFLNHAGDWSSLIERSDTDFAIESFINCALGFPDLNFSIRLHPTMATSHHEGINSRHRISKLLDSSSLPNLRLSTNSLDYELSMASICVSEYSDLVLRCISRSIKTITLNPTNRRNFLQFLIDIGLPEAKSCHDLKEFISHHL